MIKHFNNNKEINEKLFKYMTMYLATNNLYFTYMKRYIPKSIRDELLKTKWHRLNFEKINQYKEQIIPPQLPESIKQNLQQEIDMFVNQQKKKEQKQYINFLYKITKKKTKIIKNICFLSGRSRAVYRIFHLSRLKIREHAQYGQFIGFKKISW